MPGCLPQRVLSTVSAEAHAAWHSKHGRESSGTGAAPERAHGVQEDDVREYWGYCGEVADLDLMRFPDTGRFRGIAFITFATARTSPAALHLHAADSKKLGRLCQARA
jgi:hypothetical protein